MPKGTASSKDQPHELVNLSPQEFHENVSSTIQRSIQRPLPSMEVRFRDLSITVNLDKCAKGPLPRGRCKPANDVKLPTTKKILSNISGVFKPGTITLVLGQPGSGKSSLMKILSGRFRVRKDVMLGGEITYNGRPRQQLLSRLPQFVVYVDQHDCHLPTLTVRETLEFAHECNGGGKLTALDKARFDKGTADDNQVAIDIVSEMSKVMPRVIIQHLGLTTCQDTIVGNAMLRGVSGGQRKRVTTGEMLFGHKQVFIMDEISTGLDSASTFDIIKSQRSLAKTIGKTIVISLLQPSPEVFELFDDVLVVNEGEVIYHGPQTQVVEYFRDMGLACPPRRDVADFLLDLGTAEQLTYHEPGRQGIPRDGAQLASAFRESAIYRATMELLDTPTSEQLTKDMTEFMDPRKAFRQSMGQGFVTLLKRDFLILSRNTLFLRARIGMVLVMGLLNGSIFYDIDPALAQITMGTLFGAVMFMSMGQMAELATFFANRDVFYKQRGANFIRASGYVVSFMASKVPMAIAEAIVFGSLIYWLCGLVADAAAYFLFLLLLILINLAFAAYFFLLTSVLPDLHVAKPVAMLSIGIFVVFAGFIVSKDHIPDYFIWVYWIDPLAWCIRGLIVSQYRNAVFDRCEYGGQDYCALTGKTMGEYSLSLFDVPSDKLWIGAAVAYLVGLSCLNMALTALALEYIRHDSHASTAQTVTSTDVFDQIERISVYQNSARVAPHEADDSITTNTNTKNNNSNGDIAVAPAPRGKYTVPPVTLAFKDLWYAVPDPANPKSGETIDLLKGITGFAAPGSMTALMGSSGAGKTTLMDVIAGRKTGGTIRGEILLNGAPATKQVIQRCTGYCEQMDVHCESATIREALTFSAFLRQPSEVSARDKLQTVRECLDLLDLHAIADQRIHGRSTEQLKRTTIAVELAAKPSVLFLDEPTSGLDARSAKAIMEGVRKVADSGRTIICTIHQPSTEIFVLFDRLLLLKTGGQTVFHGAMGPSCASLISYFEAIPGVPRIASSYNPATWMLECIGAGVGNAAAENTDFAVVYQASALRLAVDTAMAEPGVSTPAPGSEPVSFSHHYAATQATQMRFVVHRFFAMYWRTKSYTMTGLIMAVVLALLFGGIFTGSQYASYQGVNSGVGMIFLSCFFLGAVAFNGAIPMAAEQRVSFYREQAAQMYHPFWYFLGATLAEVPFVLLRCIVFTAIFYPFVGFTGAAKGTLFGVNLTLLVLLQTYLGQLFAYALPSIEIATLMGALFNSVTGNFMGFNPPAAAIPAGYKWLYYLTPQRYAIANFVAIVFAECGPDSTASELGCLSVANAPLTLGELTIKGYVELVFNMPHDDIVRNMLILIGCIIGLRFLALLSLCFINHQKR